MNKKIRDLYESFHKAPREQKFIVQNNDYTHGPLIKITKRYLHRKSKILNLGCGTGSLDFNLAKNGHNILGVDISQNAIESAKKNATKFGLSKKIKFIVSSVEEFEIKDVFDAVFCIEVVEHVKNDFKLMQKIHGMLKPGGILILSTPSLNAPLYKIGFLNEFDKRVGHLRRYSEKSLSRIMENANLEIVEFIKTEGLLRNFIFNSKIGGKIILRLVNKFAFTRYPIQFVDNILVKIFGESDFIVICKKKTT